ncbi:DMT family transporter [Shimia sp. CNT1-13L.2]|uniref:DMT family transporter n=1 Tax=Shimia sp. CNT1-13L.2 TaxID=2959663 RepID=UPI0020CDCE54|nr:DMT family transporter [Shimia sp. CNT1-13L.2]MCP9481627.1 DMT family transporter [Shimia sp. CNT1-13L.2]
MENAQQSSGSASLLHSPTVALILVIGASAAFGTVPYFARLLSEAGMAAPAIAFFRYAFTPILLFRHIRLDASHHRASLWGIFAGMGTGLGWIFYVRSLDVMPVSTAGILYMTYPLFTLMFSRLLFGEALTLRACVASLLILGAAILGAGQINGEGATWSAIALALLAPVSFGFVINVISHRLTILTPRERMTTVPLGSMIVLIPVLLSLPAEQVLPQSGEALIALCVLGLFTAFLPNYLYMRFSPVIGANTSAVAGSIELPTMFVIGWLAFAEVLTWQQIIAGCIILAAITLSSARRVRNIANVTARPRPRFRRRRKPGTD